MGNFIYRYRNWGKKKYFYWILAWVLILFLNRKQRKGQNIPTTLYLTSASTLSLCWSLWSLGCHSSKNLSSFLLPQVSCMNSCFWEVSSFWEWAGICAGNVWYSIKIEGENGTSDILVLVEALSPRPQCHEDIFRQLLVFYGKGTLSLPFSFLLTLSGVVT